MIFLAIDTKRATYEGNCFQEVLYNLKMQCKGHTQGGRHGCSLLSKSALDVIGVLRQTIGVVIKYLLGVIVQESNVLVFKYQAWLKKEALELDGMPISIMIYLTIFRGQVYIRFKKIFLTLHSKGKEYTKSALGLFFSPSIDKINRNQTRL